MKITPETAILLRNVRAQTAYRTLRLGIEICSGVLVVLFIVGGSLVPVLYFFVPGSGFMSFMPVLGLTLEMWSAALVVMMVSRLALVLVDIADLLLLKTKDSDR